MEVPPTRMWTGVLPVRVERRESVNLESLFGVATPEFRLVSKERRVVG
jgi:hypothetical protein